MTEEEEEVVSPPNVVICGGGPSGLLASILLNNIGIKSTVLEEAIGPDRWSSKSYSMILNSKGVTALEKGGCLAAAMEVGTKRTRIYFLDGQTGDTVRTIHKDGIAFSRPLLVECLEHIARTLPHVTLRRGVGVSSVTTMDDEKGLYQVHLRTKEKDETTKSSTIISATHVIGADGKWSKVRQSFPSSFRAEMITCPSFGVSLFAPTVPDSWSNNATYIIKPPDECLFYVVVSPLPTGGMSLSMVCFDQTIKKYPWLEPPPSTTNTNTNTNTTTKKRLAEGWKEEEEGESSENEYSSHSAAAATSTTNSNNNSTAEEDDEASSNTTLQLSDHLETLFRGVIPAFYAVLDKKTYPSARIKRRVTWLRMSNSYSTEDGHVTLIGDAAHAMTPSMGEGGNCAMESAMKLVNAISTTMKEKKEQVCSITALNEAFIQYGISRPKEVQPVQELSAARNNN